MKPKKCKQCGQKFTPARGFQPTCSTDCAILWARDNPQFTQTANKRIEGLAKRTRSRQKREKLKEMMPAREWIKKAQTAFNAYIRARDRHFPCICCNSWGEGEDWMPGGKWDCGHFLSRGAYPELRFHEDNAHRQLKSCNAGASKYAKKSRTVAKGYRKNLITKIGVERVEWLEGPHEPLKLTIPQIQEIERTYKAKLKALQDS